MVFTKVELLKPIHLIFLNSSNQDYNQENMEANYMDFKKAFNKINHRILMKKLAESGIHGNLLV